MSRFWSFAREEVPACRALVPVFAETTPRSVSLAPMLLRTEVVACRQAATTRGYTLTRGMTSDLIAASKPTPAREAMKEFRRADVNAHRELTLGRTGTGRNRLTSGAAEQQVIGRTTARTGQGEAIEAEVLGKGKPESKTPVDVPDAEVVAEHNPRALA